MDIVYQQFVNWFLENKPDVFQSPDLQVMFISGEYEPDKEHNYPDVIKYRIERSNNISIRTNRVIALESSTQYLVNNLIAINTYGARYICFFCNTTKSVIYAREITVSKLSQTFRFGDGILFEIKRDGSVRFEQKTKAVSYKCGNHKLVITGGKK